MRERAEEPKATARRGSGAGKADGENDVLAKIAEMQESAHSSRKPRVESALDFGSYRPVGLIWAQRAILAAEAERPFPLRYWRSSPEYAATDKTRRKPSLPSSTLRERFAPSQGAASD